jgi:glycopeptide antibiotics resistance protein
MRSYSWRVKLLISSVLFVAICTLFPFQFMWDGSLMALLDRVQFRPERKDIVMNILLFLPVGFSLNRLLGSLGWVRSIIFALLICGAVSTSVETLQMFLPSRNPNVVDIMSNSLGGIVGYGLGQLMGDRGVNQLKIWRQWLGKLSRGQVIALFLGHLTLAACIVASLPNPTLLTNWDSHMPLVLGNENSGDRPWGGIIESVYMSDRAWSEAEIKQAVVEQKLPQDLAAAYDLSREPFRDGTGNLPNLKWNGDGIRKDVTVSAELWLKSDGNVVKLNDRIRQSSQFTVMTTIASGDLKQQGPARIISISRSPFQRNFTIGQEKTDLHVRLRTAASDDNGVKPSFVIPNFFADKLLQHLVVTYHDAMLRMYVIPADRLAEQPIIVYAMDAPADFISRDPENFMMYHGLVFLPLGFLSAMILRRSQQRSRWVAVTVLTMILSPLLLTGLMAIEANRSLRLDHWLIGMVFMIGGMGIYWFGLPTRAGTQGTKMND